MRNLYKSILPLAAAVAAGATLVPPAGAHPPRPRDQDQAFRFREQGRIMPLRDIENRIVPHMRGFDYLGPELQATVGRDPLKLRRGQQVVWIDVDARTGDVVARSGF